MPVAHERPESTEAPAQKRARVEEGQKPQGKSGRRTRASAKQEKEQQQPPNEQQQGEEQQKDDSPRQDESQEQQDDSQSKEGEQQNGQNEGGNAEASHPPLREATAHVVSALRELASATFGTASHLAVDVGGQIKTTAVAATRGAGAMTSTALHKGTEATGQAAQTIKAVSATALQKGTEATGQAAQTIKAVSAAAMEKAAAASSTVKETTASTFGTVKEQLAHGAEVAGGKLRAVGNAAVDKAADLGDFLLADDNQKADEKQEGEAKEGEKTESDAQQQGGAKQTTGPTNVPMDFEGFY
jgi:hypothetical protein